MADFGQIRESPLKQFTATDSNRIDIITMGCSKNLVDSERLMRCLEAKGYRPVHNNDDVQGPIVVVNTCGFIADAKQESIDMILELAQAKTDGRIRSLIVMGCLSQRHGPELKPEIPEVDRWYGKFDWELMTDDLPSLRVQSKPRSWERSLTTPSYSTFMKISEGCDPPLNLAVNAKFILKSED